MKFELKNRKTPASWLGLGQQTNDHRQHPRDTVRNNDQTPQNLFQANRQSISPIRQPQDRITDANRFQDRNIILNPTSGHKIIGSRFKQADYSPLNTQLRKYTRESPTNQNHNFVKTSEPVALNPKPNTWGVSLPHSVANDRPLYNANFKLLQRTRQALNTLLNKYMIGYFVLFVIAEISCFNGLQYFAFQDSAVTNGSQSSWIPLIKLITLRSAIVYIFYSLYYFSNIYQFDGLEIYKSILRGDCHFIAHLVAVLALLWASIGTFQSTLVIFENQFQANFFALCKYFIVIRFLVFNLLSSKGTDFESLNSLSHKRSWREMFSTFKNHLTWLVSMIALNTLLYFLFGRIFHMYLGFGANIQQLHAEHIWNFQFMPMMALLYVYTTVAIELYVYAIRFSISTTLKNYFPTKHNTLNVLELLLDLNCDHLNEDFINLRIERNVLTYLNQSLSIISDSYFNVIRVTNEKEGPVDNWRSAFAGFNKCLRFMHEIMALKDRFVSRPRYSSLLDSIANFRQVVLKETETRKQYLRSHMKIYNWLYKLKLIKELVVDQDDFPLISLNLVEIREFADLIETLIPKMSVFIGDLIQEKFSNTIIEQYEFFVWNLENLHIKVSKLASGIPKEMPIRRVLG